MRRTARTRPGARPAPLYCPKRPSRRRQEPPRRPGSTPHTGNWEGRAGRGGCWRLGWRRATPCLATAAVFVLQAWNWDASTSPRWLFLSAATVLAALVTAGALLSLSPPRRWLEVAIGLAAVAPLGVLLAADGRVANAPFSPGPPACGRCSSWPSSPWPAASGSSRAWPTPPGGRWRWDSSAAAWGSWPFNSTAPTERALTFSSSTSFRGWHWAARPSCCAGCFPPRVSRHEAVGR